MNLASLPRSATSPTNCWAPLSTVTDFGQGSHHGLRLPVVGTQRLRGQPDAAFELGEYASPHIPARETRALLGQGGERNHHGLQASIDLGQPLHHSAARVGELRGFELAHDRELCQPRPQRRQRVVGAHHVLGAVGEFHETLDDVLQHLAGDVVHLKRL